MKTKIALTLLSLTLSSCWLLSDDESEKLKQERKLLSNNLVAKYSIESLMDTIKRNYSIEFDSIINKYQITTKTLKVIDIYKENNINKILLSGTSSSLKYLKLSVTDDILKELLIHKSKSGSLRNKIIVFKLSKIKRLNFILRYDEDLEDIIEIATTSNRFIGDGELIEFVSINY